jgi:formylglycine-generating enzyme required for sulfatase activity
MRDEGPVDTSSMNVETKATEAVKPGGFQAGDVREINIPGTDVTFTLVYVPNGTYRIGSPEGEEGRENDEGPVQNVNTDGFWMGQFEVSDDEFGIFRNPDRDADTTAVPNAVYRVDAVSRPSPPYEDPAFGMGGSGKPAVGMTQWAGLHYAKWLTEKTGVFFRLPSEAEWEVACRAGADPSDMSPLTGRLLGAVGWYDQNSDFILQDIGQKRPNAWGIYDMLGNAAEWTLDEYAADYHARIAEAPANPWIEPTRLHPRTVRGGDYGEAEASLRCGARLESTTDWKRRDPQIPKSFWWNTDSPFVGFRIMAPESAPTEEEQALFWTLVLGE